MNEHRVSIIVNVQKLEQNKDLRSNEKWPKISYLAVFEGFGGIECAEYLRDRLINILLTEETFPSDPERALRLAFAKVDAEFLQMAHILSVGKMHPSGSSALVALIVDEYLYVANCGDSTALLGFDGGL